MYRSKKNREHHDGPCGTSGFDQSLKRITAEHEFLSKGAHFANLTGEKLSEHHVTRAMAAVLRQLDLALTCYSVAPCWDDDTPYYGLFVERPDVGDNGQGSRLAALLDQQLGEENIEYRGKRDSLRLRPVRLELLPAGAWAQWDRQRLQRTGGTPEQYKHPCLINDMNFRATMPVEAEVAALAP